MQIDLTDVFTSEGQVAAFHVPLEMTSFRSKLGEFEIRKKSLAEFTFTNLGKGRVKVGGHVDISFSTLCDRCLAETPTKLPLRFERIIDSLEERLSERDTAHREDRASGPMPPDMVRSDMAQSDMIQPDYMEGYQFNAESFIFHEILINWPMKILCKPDCKGVCPMCGQNLNQSECECDTFVPDPRMAAINEIFKAGKEV